jgi:hypothetical protein
VVGSVLPRSEVDAVDVETDHHVIEVLYRSVINSIVKLSATSHLFQVYKPRSSRKNPVLLPCGPPQLLYFLWAKDDFPGPDAKPKKQKNLTESTMGGLIYRESAF